MFPSELPELDPWVPVAVDTETSNLHPDDPPKPEGGRPGVSTVSVAWWEGDQVRAFAFPFDQGTYKLPDHQLDMFEPGNPNLGEDEWRALLLWLMCRRLVFHNAPFDLKWLKHGTRLWKGEDLTPHFWFDTMLASRAIWPTEAAALKASGARLELAGGDEEDDQVALRSWIKNAKLGKGIGTKQNPRYDLVPWNVMEPYARTDADLTIRLYRAEQQALQWECDGMVHDVIQREFDLAIVLFNIEQRGLGFDCEGAAAAAAKLRRRVAKLEEKLPFRPTPLAAKQFWELHHLDEEGQVVYDSLDAEARARMGDLPGMAEWDAHQRASRALSMWFIGWPSMIGPDGRLRATFRQGHVRSGRLSVERVQLHAIPNRHGHIEGVPHVRSLFKAKEGHELWNLDLSQAELRIAAKQANCVRMLEMLEGGADLHGVTTTEVFKIDPDHHEWKIRRDAGKRLTFSAIFQIGPQEYQRVLAKEGLHWSLAECDRAVYAWRDTYPEFGQSFYRWMRVAENQGWIELVGGERAWFYVPHVDKPATAWSRRVQGSLALFVKRWLIDAEKTCRRQGTPDALVGTVHDSLVLELPQERGAEIARLVADRAERSGRAMFDIDMPVEVSPWHD